MHPDLDAQRWTRAGLVTLVAAMALAGIAALSAPSLPSTPIVCCPRETTR